jgi:hypothetical protein
VPILAVLQIQFRIQLKGRIRIRIKVKSWMRIPIKISDKLDPDPDPHQFADGKAKFEHFFMVLSLNLAARIRFGPASKRQVGSATLPYGFDKKNPDPIKNTKFSESFCRPGVFFEVMLSIFVYFFRPDMKMLEMPEYALYEIHESGKSLYMRLELDF